MKQHKILIKTYFMIGLPILSLIFIIFYTSFSFIEPSIKKTITIASGAKGGNYYKTALKYKKLLEDEKVKVTILETSGSVENIKLIQEQKADIGFTQSGILTKQNKDHKDKIYSLASLYYEPLWVFYRNKGYSIDYLIQLVSRRISIGTEGSGTHYLSKQLLNANGINSENCTMLSVGSIKSKQMLIDKEIDAIFIVSSANSDAVNELLGNPKINALSFKRSEAYDSKYSFLSSLILHEGTVDLYRNLPDENKKLLTTTANLIASKNLPDELVRLVLIQAKKIHSHKGIFEKEFQFPNLNNLDTPIHEEATKYLTYGNSWLEKIFPFWIASNIDRLKILIIPLLTILIPLLKGVVPLYVITMRSKIYRWYRQLSKADKKIDNSSKAQLKELEDELSSLKIEVQEQTKVPLSYMGEYYNLLLHIDLVIDKIKKSL